MQKLLSAVKQPGGPPFDAVLVDNQSRLSRDLGDVWNTIFGGLAVHRVVVIDCMTGMRSDQANAKTFMGMTAVMDQAFLEKVAHETRRGLERRAREGVSTGGRVYGYGTTAEPNPSDPEHPFKRIVIIEDEAAVVRRIFALWISGEGLKAIADRLNREGVAAPHDGGKGYKGNRGFPHTTVRAILCNERYLGKLTWQKTQWIRVPGTAKRRQVPRPREQWVEKVVPELRIIDDHTWKAAQSRFRTIAPSGGRPAGITKPAHSNLLCGLLKCGRCGGNMIVVSRTVKRGKSYGNFGCSTYSSRGSAICSNNQTIGVATATDGIVDALKQKLSDEKSIHMFVEEVQAAVKKLRAIQIDPRAELEKAIKEAERCVANATNVLTRLGWSDAIAQQLRVDEARLANLRELLEQAAKPQTYAIPTVDDVKAHFADLIAVLEKRSIEARQAIQRYAGYIKMTPEPDGYLAEGRWNLRVKYKTPGPRAAEGAGVGVPAEVCGNQGSGGRI